MLLSQNAHDLIPPPASLDLEYLHEVLLETPGSVQGITPDSSSGGTPDPSSLLPQVTAPVPSRTSLCAVCSASTSLLPPPPPPAQIATPAPPNWHRIPQKAYNCGENQWDYTPSGGISFRVNGYPGVNMGDALRKRFTGLNGRDDLVLQDASNVVSCRIKFPGYPSNSLIQVGMLVLVMLPVFTAIKAFHKTLEQRARSHNPC